MKAARASVWSMSNWAGLFLAFAMGCGGSTGSGGSGGSVHSDGAVGAGGDVADGAVDSAAGSGGVLGLDATASGVGGGPGGAGSSLSTTASSGGVDSGVRSSSDGGLSDGSSDSSSLGSCDSGVRSSSDGGPSDGSSDSSSLGSGSSGSSDASSSGGNWCGAGSVACGTGACAANSSCTSQDKCHCPSGYIWETCSGTPCFADFGNCPGTGVQCVPACSGAEDPGASGVPCFLGQSGVVSGTPCDGKSNVMCWAKVVTNAGGSGTIGVTARLRGNLDAGIGGERSVSTEFSVLAGVTYVLTECFPVHYVTCGSSFGSSYCGGGPTNAVDVVLSDMSFSFDVTEPRFLTSGVAEYWVVDVQGGPTTGMQEGSNGLVSTNSGGWAKLCVPAP